MRLTRLAPICLSLFLAASPCVAQTVDSTEDAFDIAQGASVPPYVVPVLRLVSKTHVEPTTGLVLSESGLVLVPAGFASEGDEIVVLDGGNDIVSNGRTARVDKNFPMDGVQILSVYGLRRPAAPFADFAPEDGDEVRLAAFPPAEKIAEGGAQPLDIPTTLTVFGENTNPAVSGEAPVPNVSGPLLDECGNVVAFSIAHDIQTMETTPGTRYQWRDTLLGIIDTLGIRPGLSACVAELPEPEPEETPPPPVEEAQPEPAPAEPEPEPIEEPEAAEDEAAEDTLPEEEQPKILPPIELDEEPVPEEALPPLEEQETPATAWPWLLVAALLIAGGFGLHRWRKSLNEVPEEVEPTPPAPPEDDDPGFQEPVMDSVLFLDGSLGGRPLNVSCPVSSHAVNVVIGRGQVDLQVSSTAVSRQHAALNGEKGALTITDLGSNNGTLINGVPCLEDEIMYVEPGDTITLGDARFTVEIRPAGDGE